MNRIILVCAFLIIGVLRVLAQNQPDSIEIRISAGINYYQNGNKLSQKQLLTIMKTDNMAYSEMVTAKSNSDASVFLGATGGFLIGYQLGKQIAGGYPNKLWIGVGGVLMMVSIPFTIESGKHAKKAVRYYNDGLKQYAIHKQYYNFRLSSNGLGVSLRF